MKKKVISVLVAATMVVSLFTACGSTSKDSAAADKTKTEDTAEASDKEAKDVSDLVIGEIEYAVVEDGGWAQAMHESMLAACKNLGIDTEKNLLTAEEIAEEDPSLIESTIEEMVDNGADIIFGCSTGYGAVLAEMQEEYPDVVFAQYENDIYENVVEFQIRGYEGEFLAGYLSALMNTESNQFGFCASMDEASVRTALNSYALGAKYGNPDATVQVLWADSWYDLDVEGQNAKTLIDNGIKYMGMEASSPAVPQTCEQNGAFCIGYNINMQPSAPKAVLTSFTWNFAPIFEEIMQQTADGTIKIDTDYYEGGDCAKLADFNADLVPADVQAKVNELKDKIASGEVSVYAGELKDDQGNVLVEEGQVMSDEDILAQDFFVSNVTGGKK
ncbi:MAG: BMP family ABC transporter substrate-binding protein [Lachnospiraceae bacterium]|nr:BMP family ABC transporter substrate-binding protein [Lachnospiraceae bacterium]